MPVKGTLLDVFVLFSNLGGLHKWAQSPEKWQQA